MRLHAGGQGALVGELRLRGTASCDLSGSSGQWPPPASRIQSVPLEALGVANGVAVARPTWLRLTQRDSWRSDATGQYSQYTRIGQSRVRAAANSLLQFVPTFCCGLRRRPASFRQSLLRAMPWMMILFSAPRTAASHDVCLRQ